MTNVPIKHPKAQTGFSLIEVLISLLVIGVGLLGLASLQITSMKGTSNAHSRVVANILAMELGERMRANPLGVDGGFYDDDVNCSDNESSCRNANFCTAEEAAKFDVQEIMCGMKRSTRREGGVANTLPNGNLDVSCPSDCSDKNAVHNVRITWGDRNVHQEHDGSMDNQTLLVPIIP